MQFIDTHCHFDFAQFDGRRHQILESCRAFGLSKIVVPSVGIDNWDKVIKLAETLPEVEVALGIHPCFLAGADLSLLNDLERVIKLNRKHLVAVGETGLDRMVDVSLEKQKAFYSRQLALAADFDLAVIVHSHRMNDEVTLGLRQHKIERGVVHGFAGSLQQAEKIWALGVCLGVGGVITYVRANKTRKAIAAMPLQSLLLETDAPDMPVCGYQGQANSPERIPLIFAALCQLRSEEPEIIAEQLCKNAHHTFRITV
jgi:TatD DNase family protein